MGSFKIFNLREAAEREVERAVGKQMDNECDYCHTDVDGFVRPIEKNAHAYIYPDMFRHWKLNIRLKGDVRECDINYCPMCGRRLNE